MNLNRVLIGVAIMALVTYVPRVLPITLFRRQIKSRYLRAFLDYIPYAVLGSLTFPDIFYSTGNVVSALAGATAALLLSYRNKSLVEVALAGIAVVYVVELLCSFL